MTMKLDLDAIERSAREWGDEDATWYPNVGPRVTLALLRIVRAAKAFADEQGGLRPDRDEFAGALFDDLGHALEGAGL